MNLFLSSRNNLDEVVFENRNKQYGAYVLRKSYDENLLKATLSSMGLLLLVGSSLYGISLLKPKVDPMISEIVKGTTEHRLIRDIEIILDPTPAGRSERNTDNMRYKIVRDKHVTQPLTTPPNPTLPLNPTGTTTPGTTGSETGTTTGATTIPVITAPVVDPPIPTFVTNMPSFEGGDEAMIRYLRNELMYPPQARELGIEGKVMVEFVVQSDGSISQIKILKGFGFGSEEEAMRVVQNMPKWIPGSQNGKRLAVRLVLPLQFKLDQ